ncbi:TonB-dependent receptor [Longitalea arenae]|uniref:TonB-dependent receptor n=1 Tax=Longitalea arenae TaxID=2812558 RepID=UPI00196749DF|nr:TonB-dependent receptor [Longitalea arenae]
MKLRTWCIRSGQILTKTVLVCTGLLIFVTLFHPATAQAEDDRGGITIRQQNVPIQKVFHTIEKQSGYRFFYNETLLQGAVNVTLNLQHVSLQVALEACFRNQPLSYAIVDKTIIVKRRPGQPSAAPVTAAVSTSRPRKIIAVRGKVTSNNLPVAGASIVIKGTDNGASTDKDGIFTLPEVEEDATLVVSSVSHSAREVRLNGQSFISIDLSQRTDDLDEAVVVAYNTTTQRRNVGAVTVVKGEQITNLPHLSFDKSLQGLVPGLLVTSGTGQPGGGVSNFVLRGVATSANPENGSVVRNPLIVIDGVPVSQETSQMYISNATTAINNPLAQLNPTDIESITVLKDAAAIALYGANSSNGVIMVTTKKGKPGKTRFNIRHQTDIAAPTQLQDMLNQDEYLELVHETLANTNSYYQNPQKVIDTLKKLFPTMADGSFYAQPDWYDALYKNNATTISNDLSISGGNEKTTFYLNFEYTKQDGVVKNTGFDRKSIRLNLEHRPQHWLKFGLNTTVSHTKQDYGASTAGGNDGKMENMFISSLSPLIPIYLENGDYNFNFQQGVLAENTVNPVAAAKYNTNQNTAFRGLTNVFGEINLLKYLSFRTNVGFDFALTEAKEKADPRLRDPAIRNTGGRVEERDTRRANIISTNILQFNKQFGSKHRLGLLAGQEARILNQKILGVAVTGLSSPYYDQITSPGATVFSQAGYTLKETLLSYFGQLNYDYENKYLLTSTVRRDGSSRFGEDKRFGTYWSTGVGWVISAEPFMNAASRWMNYLKVRGSIGAAGNAGAIDRFTPYDPITPGTYSGNISVRPAGSVAGNADVKWENTFSWDAGLELRILNERLSFTADIYQRTTDNLIYSLPLSRNTGYQSILGNVGAMRNRGVELSFSANIIRKKSFFWRLDGNWSTNQNKLIKANNSTVQSQLSVAYNQEGKSFNSFYLRRWAGVDPLTGAALYMDSLGNASPDYNAAKPEFVGKAQPDGFGAITNTFNYMGLELSAILYYQYGYNILNNNSIRTVNDGYLPLVNETKDALNRWQKPGDESPNPKRTVNNISGSNRSTRTLYKGDHIRLQNIILSYQVPAKLIQLLHLSNAKVYLQGNNLALWTTANTYGDPSSANVYGVISYSYPIARTWSIGINAGF